MPSDHLPPDHLPPDHLHSDHPPPDHLPPDHPPPDRPPPDDRALAILAATVRAALRSPRMEADIRAAAIGAGLEVTGAECEAVAADLARRGCITRLIPLHDGGLLALVTITGIDALRHTIHAHIVADRPAR